MIEKEYQYDKNGYRSNRMHDEYRDDLMLPKLDKHLKDVNETYFEHMYHAITYAFTFAVLTITTLIHAMLPFLFVETASRKIREINKHIESRVTSNNTIELNLDKDA